MSYEEKSAWILGVIAIGAYGVYLAVVLSLARTTPLTEVAYVAPMLWSIGAAIAAGIVVKILVTIFSPKGSDQKDQRDRQIYRFGEYTGQSFLVIGGSAALLMALAEWDYFWIANVLYLAFVLSAVLGTITKVVAYRRGLPEW